MSIESAAEHAIGQQLESQNLADHANATLAALRKQPHNGMMFQADDVDYLNAIAVTAGNGLGAISPQWFRSQAKLVAGTLARIAELETVMGDMRYEIDKLADLMADSTELLVRDTPIIERLNNLCHFGIK